MSKIITLLAAAYVGGTLRHPHEGAISVSDADRDQLVDVQKLAVDETDGFTKDQLAEMPDEPIAIATGAAVPPALDNPHLSQVAPPAPPKPKSAHKPTPTKE